MVQMTNDFRKLYKDNVVVEVLTVLAPGERLVRKSRSLLQITTPTPVRVSATYLQGSHRSWNPGKIPGLEKSWNSEVLIKVLEKSWNLKIKV